MGWHGWFTLAVVLVTMVALATERLPASFVVVGAVTVLLLTNVVTSAQALSGFSNEAPVTIAALYVMAGAAEATGALEGFTRVALGGVRRRAGPQRATMPELARMLIPSAAVSAFIYNTPTTGMLAPRVTSWAGRTGRSPSWYLMSLNYAILLGGLCTAIGTTTNVVISGLLTASHQRTLGLFEVSPLGLSVAVAGLVAVIVLGPRLTPSRRAPSEALGPDARTFTVEMVVAKGSPMAGRTVSEAGLRNLEGVYLVEMTVDGRTIAAVSPDERLEEGARLTFAGNVGRILDLQRMPGLTSAEEPHFSVAGTGPRRRFYEAVLAPGSTLAGSTLKDAGFRSRYGAAVVAVHRSGGRLPGKLGAQTLHPGDVLLVLAGHDFRQRWLGSGDFSMIASLSEQTPLRRERALVVQLVLIGFVVAVTTGALSVLNASLVAALLLVGLRVLTPHQARQAIDLDILVTLGASFGLGAALSASGLAKQVARLLIDGFHHWGDVGLLAGVLLATVLITQVVTNNAAAILMFPIAMATADASHLSHRPFVMALVVGASASFLTPIGYQTNMMVYAMGGYRFGDFVRSGVPVTILAVLVSLLVIPLAFPFH